MNRASSIAAKIKALRAKTRAAGCTEAESIAAVELAAKLMAEHGLEAADLDMSEASVREQTTNSTWRSRLASIIAYCTNTASILVANRRDGNRIMFLGRAPGPEIALYLRDVCFRAVKTAIAEFKALSFYRRRRSLATKRQAVADFVEALVNRLANRLIELFAPLKDDAARMVAKDALTRRFEGAVAMKRPERKQRYSEAGEAGWRAANAVSLNRGVADAPRAQIGVAA